MKIGLDYDSVITDSRELKSVAAKELFSLDIPYEIFKRDPAVTRGLITDQQYRAVQRAVYYEKKYNDQAKEVTGSIETIKRLLGEGHELRVVTGRDGDAAYHAHMYLRARGVDIPLYGVGNVSKREGARGLDIFVDDDLDKLEDLDVKNRYLFSWEFNEHLTLPDKIVRIHSWKDLYERIQEVNV
jgi:hypothetical protein